MPTSPVNAAVGVPGVAAAVLAALEGGEAVVTATVIAAPPVDDAAFSAGDMPSLGRRMLVWAGRTAGSLGDPQLDEFAVELGRQALAELGAPAARKVEVGSARYELYIEAHGPPPELVIVGAGHIARPLCRIGALLGYGVTVLDDRPEFATRERFPEARRVLRADFGDPLRDVRLGPASHLVLVTRGHKHDFDALRIVLRLPVEPAYIGMVGSQRRVRAALQELAAEGVPHERLTRVHAPIGLDIGAETPEEIAVAIAAEMVRVRRGGTGGSLRDRARVVARWIAEAGRGP